MASSNGNIFRVTGHLGGEFTGPLCITAQRPVTRSFDVFFDLVWINGWVNNREVGDLRRHRVHYDVILMNKSTANNFQRKSCQNLVFNQEYSLNYNKRYQRHLYWGGVGVEIPEWISNCTHYTMWGKIYYTVVAPSQFGIWWIISSHMCMWLLIQSGIKVNPC